MSSLLELFNLVKDASRDLRVQNPQADGLAFWKPIKKTLQKYDSVTASHWKKFNKSTMDCIMSIPEHTINGKGEQTIVEINHFLIQTIRLPLSSGKPTLRKVIQIALNIGQFEGSTHSSKPWMNLSNYLTVKDIIVLSRIVSPKLIEEIQILIDSF